MTHNIVHSGSRQIRFEIESRVWRYPFFHTLHHAGVCSSTKPHFNRLYYIVCNGDVSMCIMFVRACMYIFYVKTTCHYSCVFTQGLYEKTQHLLYSHDIGFNCFYHFTLYRLYILRTLIAFYSEHPMYFLHYQYRRMHSAIARENIKQNPCNWEVLVQIQLFQIFGMNHFCPNKELNTLFALCILTFTFNWVLATVHFSWIKWK